MTYWPVHAHSEFSVLDGMDTVQTMVNRVAELSQPAMALTDHGTLAGVVQGYKAAKKAGIAFFPGVEAYVVRDVHDPTTREDRFHLGMLALDAQGYEALSKLVTLSFRKDRFYRKPIIDLSDLAYLHDEGHADHLAITTGCYFGLVVQQGVRNGWDMDAMTAMTEMLARWFPHTFVEVQNHGVTHDDGTTDLMVAETLTDIAAVLGLPVVVGGDSHYIHPHQQSAHDLMKDICYFGDGEDFHFPGGPYHLLDDHEAFGAFPDNMREALVEGHEALLDLHQVTIPPLDDYKFHVPKMVASDADQALRDEVKTGLRDFLVSNPGLKPYEITRYGQQVHHELDVIHRMGMANYFLLVKRHVTEWCRDNGIIINTRGSANGSLVCFLLGITNVDPIQWGTSFDRFLSLDRMKPPDIDIDVDFRGRDRVIEHLRQVFPTMVQVGTYARIGITLDPDTGEEKGSVLVQYMAAMTRKDPDFDKRVKPEHRTALDELAATPVYKSLGTNAAGFVLPGDDHPIDTYLPLARVISSDTTVTQITKDDVEALGYMKLDILGLRALQTLNGTLTRIGRQPNEWDWIPWDDKRACALLRSGNCVGLFQYEGFSAQRGGREMGIKNTLDVILGLALYRPALMSGGQKDQYLANRRLPRARQARLPALFDPIVNDTAGVLLFQEQVLEVLRAIKMRFQDYNDLMTAVKASNGFIRNAAETFERIEPIFYDLCEEAGLDYRQSDDTWAAVVGFTEYGFNRAHATSYGLMSYRSAYLKAHYPLEYMASLLDVWAGEKKEPLYVAEARRLGFTIVKADVNYSSPSWDIDPSRPKALRKGLVTLPGIGWNVAEAIVAHRPDGGYVSVSDFVERVPGRPVTGGKGWKARKELVGVCRTLAEAGAFRSLKEE